METAFKIRKDFKSDVCNAKFASIEDGVRTVGNGTGKTAQAALDAAKKDAAKVSKKKK